MGCDASPDMLKGRNSRGSNRGKYCLWSVLGGLTGAGVPIDIIKSRVAKDS